MADGGLKSCGANIADAYVQTGVYAACVLAGVRPADLPVQQNTCFDLLLNQGTVRATGITLPGTLLQRAAEVIK